MYELIDSIDKLTEALQQPNFWHIAATIATFIATMLALFVTFNQLKRKLYCRISFKQYSDYEMGLRAIDSTEKNEEVKIVVTNVGNKPVVMDAVMICGQGWMYKQDLILENQDEKLNNEPLHPNQRTVIIIDQTQLRQKMKFAQNTTKFETEKLVIIVFDINNKKYKTTTEYYSNQLFTQLENYQKRKTNKII